MSKVYVIQEKDFVSLLETLELHKFRGGSNLNTSVAIEIKKAIEETQATGLATGIEERLIKFIMDDAHRGFHYHVYNWIQEMKK